MKPAHFPVIGGTVNQVVSALLVGALALGVAACEAPAKAEGPVHHGRRPDGSVFVTDKSAEFVKVETATAPTRSHTRSLVAKVNFDERKLATMGPPVGGRVAAVNVVTGDRVKKGDVLMTIHSPDIAAVQAQVAEARTARILAEHTLSRTATLVKEGAASIAEQQQAAAALAQAKEEERRTSSSLVAIGGGNGTADYLLRSPIDGTVVERMAAVGNEVTVGQNDPLVKIADLSTVWVLADVYDLDVPSIKLNAEAIITVPATPGARFTGRIAYIGDIVDPLTHSARARIEIDNKDQLLRPGMFAQAQVATDAAGTVEIPISAVLAHRDQFFVFVQRAPGEFVQREVHLGEEQADRVHVLSGLQVGDKVVTQGAILLDAEANEA